MNMVMDTGKIDLPLCLTKYHAMKTCPALN